MAGAYKYRPQYTQNTIGPSGSTESYPGQHRELAAKEVVTRLLNGPMIFDDMVNSRKWCEEEAVKIIASALEAYEHRRETPESR